MSIISSKNQKILNENNDLINLIINAINFNSYIPSLNNNLTLAAENGWTNLVSAIRKLLSGERNINKFQNLDQEDQIIISEIISILTSPDTLAKFLLQQAIQQ